MLRLILMGTGPFAVPSFEALRSSGHEIALVVTRPRPPVRSRKGPPPSPVRCWAEEHQLSIYDPSSINDADAIEQISKLNAALLVVCDYGQILKPEALAAARLGGINLHGSLLPAYRGAAPVQRALLSGDQLTGVSVIHMTPRLDGGPIITTRETAIDDSETAGQLEARLAKLGVNATLEAVELLEAWDGKSEIGKPQDPALVSKAPRLSKSEGEIDWSWPSKRIDCHVRGMQPWPIAYTHVTVAEGKPRIRLAIKEVQPVLLEAQDGAATSAQASPGQLIAGDGLTIATADGAVRITRLQPSGKREMSGEEFLRGHQLSPGTLFE